MCRGAYFGLRYGMMLLVKNEGISHCYVVCWQLSNVFKHQCVNPLADCTDKHASFPVAHCICISEPCITVVKKKKTASRQIPNPTTATVLDVTVVRV